MKGTWSDTLEANSSDTCELCPAGRFSVPCQAMLEVITGDVFTVFSFGGSGDLEICMES